MKEEDKKKIQQIIGEMRCPKNFKCAETGFEILCKAEDVGLDSHLKCLEENTIMCKFILQYGNGYYCRCPLRVYLAKRLKK